MPSELQLHPLKLKQKLDYKSHYMYDMIHRDHVNRAITWLKQHNFHYSDIKLNKHWYSDIASRCYLWFPNGNIASIYIWKLTAGGLEWSLYPQQ